MNTMCWLWPLAGTCVVLSACVAEPTDGPSADDAGAPGDTPDASSDTPDLGSPDTQPDPPGPTSPVDDALPFSEGMPSWGDEDLIIGQGREELIEVVQGDAHRWEGGPQGGHHLWVGCALDDELVSTLSEDERAALPILYRIWREDGTLLAKTQRIGGLRQDGEGRWVSIGQYAVLEAALRPRSLDDERLLLRVDATLPDEPIARYRASWVTSQCCD